MKLVRHLTLLSCRLAAVGVPDDANVQWIQLVEDFQNRILWKKNRLVILENIKLELLPWWEEIVRFVGVEHAE